MKKYLSKILVLLLTLVVGLSLTACDDEKVEYNKNVPYGELTDSAYATLGELKISEKELYKLMRVNGYNYLLDTFAKTLIKATDYELDITNPEDEIVALAVVLTIDCVTEANSGASVTISSN